MTRTPEEVEAWYNEQVGRLDARIAQLEEELSLSRRLLLKAAGETLQLNEELKRKLRTSEVKASSDEARSSTDTTTSRDESALPGHPTR